LGDKQRAERGIAVERGQAGPHHAADAVDQRAERAVADDAEVEVRLSDHACTPSRDARWRARSRHAPRRDRRGASARRSARDANEDAQAVHGIHHVEGVLVGEVVADEHRPASAERRLGEEGFHRAALVGVSPPGRSSSTWSPPCTRYSGSTRSAAAANARNASCASGAATPMQREVRPFALDERAGNAAMTRRPSDSPSTGPGAHRAAT
jgi:hypothetical protein